MERIVIKGDIPMLMKLDAFLGRSARNRYIASIIVVAALLCALLSAGHVVFQTNDDSTIISWASGSLTGENEPSNGITCYLYGLLLSLLYGAISTIPWHGALLMALQALSMICALKSLLTVCARRGWSSLIGFGAFIALAFSVYAPFLYELQFTAAPGFLAAGAYALLLTRDGKRETALALVLAAFGVLIRKEAMLLTLPALLVPALCLVLQEKDARRALLTRTGALLALVAVLYGSDGALYRANNEGWEAYQAFEEQTTALMDFGGDGSALRSAGEAADWPDELSDMVSNWYFLDDRMTVESLEKVNAALASEKASPTLLSVLRATGSVVKAYPIYQLSFALFALICLVLFIQAIRKKRFWLCLAPVGLVAYALLAIAYFYGALGRFPVRVAFAAMCPLYTAYLIYAGLTLDVAPKRSMARVACAAGLLICAAYGLFTLSIPAGETGGAALTKRVNAYAAKDQAVCYLTDVAQEYDPFAIVDQGACRNVIFWGHGLTGAPALRKQQSVNGYSGFARADFYADQTRVLVTGEAAMERLLRYLRADDAGARCELIDQEDGFAVYRLYRR